MEGRRPLRLVIPPVADGSELRSLGGLARAVANSLANAARRRAEVQVITGAAARAAQQRFENPRFAGSGNGADAMIQGVVNTVGDSVEVILTLRSASNPEVGKAMRHSMHRSEAAGLPAAVTPMVTAWIENREETSRAARTIKGPDRTQIDSMVREAQRLRDAMRQRPPKPDSPASRI